jgi:hypothetical protein
VQHFLQTGSYRSYDWLAANKLFQAHWGLCTRFRLFVHESANVDLALVFLGPVAFYFPLPTSADAPEATMTSTGSWTSSAAKVGRREALLRPSALPG